MKQTNNPISCLCSFPVTKYNLTTKRDAGKAHTTGGGTNAGCKAGTENNQKLGRCVSCPTPGRRPYKEGARRATRDPNRGRGSLF